jgi:transposase-like protein
MTLRDLTQMFSTDEQCRALLVKLRWPNGVECLRCKSKNIFELVSYSKFECKECLYQFSVTTQTIFHDTHLPLDTWFTAVLLIVEARKGMSAMQVKRTLWGQHKGSYKTAWYLCHRIRAAMAEASKGQTNLTGAVEIDECYLGGKRKGVGRGHGIDNKIPVIGFKERGGRTRFIAARDLDQEKLYDLIAKNVDTTVDVIMTDESKLYNFGITAHHKAKHERVNHSAGEYVRGDVTTNGIESAFSLLKRGLMGTWHKISVKHLPAYLQEMTFRFDRRNNTDIFMDTLRHMITAPVLTFEKLTA